MKLSLPTRIILCGLLDGGATYDECRQDDAVAAECAEKDLTLHGTTFKAYMNGVEFDEFRERARKNGESEERDRFSARCIRDDGKLEDMVDVANYELMRRALNGLKDEENEIDAKQLVSLARAMKTASECQWEKKEAELIEKYELKLVEQREKDGARISTLEKERVELLDAIDRLRETKKVDSGKVADELDRALGVR